MIAKFRFWSGHKMFYMDTPENIQVITECISQQITFDSNFKNFPSYDHVGKHGASFMQFTGLLDANGRDIYEGDLVTCEPSKIIRKIIFHNGCFKLESAGGLILNNLGSYMEFNNVQIIGNIYETAETEEN